ncbi:MAG: 4Fe-4S dicluster domain-containing protein [Desulfobacula sp.]|jgi:formate dehydrogenase iron-sulfur subunit|uniref:4Fe-4S dicluster domain-containing protein n=1 Tax=Desulfobacula sp. TaxID=2593537 RepID=UPI001E00A0EB|nr:4Fe-4S dicluster domain-containing protein [Desulfobacula sp.]MBT3484273.1 4Fe-4S dicluster domain-containing protein [Desulfobacula sp.]MBT3804253.1 4Fe-4S dicluster domain-containing protein [Desulfobacula sp.]MBT4025623.1 4Fe-4S dicluster domain-containing protein [Desulfobacula sp.]MBT4198199.1 4Fe-4S dicluster domain-containing protein [Desulfobacula sp.]
MKKKSFINRRQFIKAMAGLSIAPAIGLTSAAGADINQFGKLADTFTCIGCKRCMSACKRWNSLKVERNELVSDKNTDLSGNNWVVVNLRSDKKNKTQRNYMHWACQHCQEPACAGVCPVSAIKKLDSGPVVINEKKCIGCRYCYQACPFKVPRFDFEKRVTRKCTLCYNRFPLNYKKPACVAACPVGALAFGYRHEIIREAKKRLHDLKKPGYIMGIEEAGGTAMITLLPARPENMGLIQAPKKIINQDLDKIRITSGGFMGASIIAYAMYLYSGIIINPDKENNDSTN